MSPKILKTLVEITPTLMEVGGKMKKTNKKKPKEEIAELSPHVVDGIGEAIKAISDYLKLAEMEHTKRSEIIARRDIALASIQAHRESFKELMSHTFQERAFVLQKQFETLDKAVANGDASTVAAALNGMVTVIQATPFKNAEEMHKALGSKDFIVRLD